MENLLTFLTFIGVPVIGSCISNYKIKDKHQYIFGYTMGLTYALIIVIIKLYFK
jgi:hypothetical protein